MNAFIEFFEQFARKTSLYSGKPVTFMLAVMIIVLWAITGPIFNFSDTWQLVINTGTTIITFLMVFLVQSAQNRDAKALQLKLDELIFKMQKADNVMMNIEELSENELIALSEKYKKLRRKRSRTRRKKKDVETVTHNGKTLALVEKEGKKGKKRRDETVDITATV